MNYLISKLALRLTLSIIAVLLLLFFTSSVFSQTGYLFIESVPERAEIMIDGKEYYRYFTPVLCTLAVGEHKVTVTKPYYQPETFSVTVTAETVTRKLVHFVLEDLATPSKRDAVIVKKKIGQLTILTNPFGATVLSDDKNFKATTPITLTGVSAGKHSYSIIYNDIKVDTTIIISGDSPQTLSLDLHRYFGKDEYSNVPHIKMKVVMKLPGCEYQMAGDNKTMLIKGVDAEIRISTGDTSLTLTHFELADFDKDKQGGTMKKSELTYLFEPYLYSELRIDVITFANQTGMMLPHTSAEKSIVYYSFPASLNDGEEINVRILIEEDGDIIVRYW